MLSLPAWWGLSFTQTLLVVALLLLIIDFFILSDVPTLMAHVLFAWAIAVQFDQPVLVVVLIGVVTWILLVVFHYMVWRALLERLAKKIAPARYQSGPERLVGRRGLIRHIEGRYLVSVEGELWEFEAVTPVQPGQNVAVVAQRDGFLIVDPGRAPTPTGEHG